METVRLKIQQRAPVLRLHLEAGLALTWYGGPYEAVPLWSDQTLATKDKTMRGNVLFRKIPLESVENPSGGNTVTIGG